MRQVVRQLDILRTLQARRYGASARELADEYAVTVRTVQRDLGDLREAGFLLRAGAGLWVDEVEHEGNQSSSVEEVARVREVVADLLQEGVTWTDMKGKVWRLELRDTGGGAVQCAGGRFAGGAWR